VWFYSIRLFCIVTYLPSSIKTEAFDFKLPQELIAQHPIKDSRDRSRLLHFNRSNQSIRHLQFQDVTSFLNPGDLLVLNNTKVIPSRLRGEKVKTGGKMELLLIEETGEQEWLAMLKPGKRAHPGTLIDLHNSEGNRTGTIVEVINKTEGGQYHVKFSEGISVLEELEKIGEIPLPPYIHRDQAPTSEDKERYQTVYSEFSGSVAAPTAGLHYTPELLKAIELKGVKIAYVTLHVGLGTFFSVKSEWVADHQMHEEKYMVPEDTLKLISQTRANGGKITAVGTTSLRVLESLASYWKATDPIRPFSESTGIFIYPPHKFHLTDRLITNFHLPMSSLIMLVSAFSSPERMEGKDQIKKVYQEAIEMKYRFFSYGDAMLID
jgi:S-adenosylmethionine:tRNA ribosyltransferase-isomerase